MFTEERFVLGPCLAKIFSESLSLLLFGSEGVSLGVESDDEGVFVLEGLGGVFEGGPEVGAARLTYEAHILLEYYQ